MNRYQKILVVIFSLVLLFVYGAGEAATTYIYGPVKSLPSPSYKLKGTVYVPLILVCESQGLNWEWDPVGKVVVLKKGAYEARLKVGGYRIYANGIFKELEKPVLFHEGIVVVPFSFAEKTVQKIFKEWVAKPQEEAVSAEGEYAIKTIILDPGHGGKDPGAMGRYGLEEKDIVLDIAKNLKEELENNGIKVILTRDRDTFISLGKRASIANRKEGDFFISVHANAFRAKRIKGFEAYFLSDATDDIARALEAAENASLKYEDESFDNRNAGSNLTVWDLELTENRKVSRELAKSICGAVSGNLAVRNRGDKSARFYVLKNVNMPAVLIEVGFISNSNDAQSLESPYYKKKLAEAIANGILTYKKRYEKTNGFTE